MSILAFVPPESTRALTDAGASFGGGCRVESATSVGDLLARLQSTSWRATVLSMGSELVEEALVARIGALGSAGALVLTTPTPSLAAALTTERVGAMALLTEPLDAGEVGRVLSDILGEAEERPLPGHDVLAAAGLLIGESPAMSGVFRTIAQAAGASSTVLITGESGTGKEVVARAIHEHSPRRGRPFIAVNCAAIPEHLLESELFGHEKGAFTGAAVQRKGRFERAHGGTLFLDEIGDMSIVLQAKVLRALEERVIERVGAQAVEPVDVRVVAATNQRLRDAIAEGRFREDLYYRLGVVEIELPSLRERGADIERLALHFAAHFAHAHGRPIRGITERALARIRESDWPGNVRELRNVMDRAVLLTPGDVIRSASLRLGLAAPRASARSHGDEARGYPASMSLAEVEADHLRRVLDSAGGQIGKAAEVLGIHRNTLARKVQDYSLRPGSDG